jgi:hypothetical protein
MKKLLGIVVLGLLWCNVGVAEILKFNCKNIDPTVKNAWIKYTINTDTSELIQDFKKQSGELQQAIPNILDITGTVITYEYLDYANHVFKFDFGKDSFVDYQIKPKREASIRCEGRSGSGFAKKAKKIEIASMIDRAKDTCKSLGFKESTDKFADCALKLYSQSVELAAEQNKTVVMQPQSSGSNGMTIYDPVRDNQRLMDQGMKMITGRCTLGYDC